MTEKVKVFKSHTEDYHHAFQTFLDHTDQKHKAKAWMDSFVTKLPERKIFLDAGAGNGKVTAWFTSQFENTIALEPSPSLCAELRMTCPGADVHEATILGAKVKTSADFILASHVFYYIPKEEWLINLARLTSWLSPGGSLVIMIQNTDTDCMGMLKHFHKKSFDLRLLAEDFKAREGNEFSVEMETVTSHISTPDFKSAYIVAEFMMNLLPMPEPPPRSELEAYVEKHFSAGAGKYRFSCHQDFLQIRRKF
jgi:SAM-dependent methyltransferase